MNSNPTTDNGEGANLSSNVNSSTSRDQQRENQGATPIANLQGGQPGVTKGTQLQRGIPNAHPVMGQSPPQNAQEQGLLNVQVETQYAKQNQGLNAETNNSISFLGQKVDGLERVISNLLQFHMMLRPAYCPPQIPQIQTLVR